MHFRISWSTLKRLGSSLRIWKWDPNKNPQKENTKHKFEKEIMQNSLSDYTSLVYFWLFQKAVEVMCIVPKRCNDMMNVGRLQGFDVRSHFSQWSVKQYNIFLKACVNISLSLPPGEDCGSGPPFAAGHIHGVRPRRRSARPDEGEEGFPVWAACHLQWAPGQKERVLSARLPL